MRGFQQRSTLTLCLPNKICSPNLMHPTQYLLFGLVGLVDKMSTSERHFCAFRPDTHPVSSDGDDDVDDGADDGGDGGGDDGVDDGVDDGDDDGVDDGGDGGYGDCAVF